MSLTWKCKPTIWLSFLCKKLWTLYVYVVVENIVIYYVLLCLDFNRPWQYFIAEIARTHNIPKADELEVKLGWHYILKLIPKKCHRKRSAWWHEISYDTKYNIFRLVNTIGKSYGRDNSHQHFMLDNVHVDIIAACNIEGHLSKWHYNDLNIYFKFF